MWNMWKKGANKREMLGDHRVPEMTLQIHAKSKSCTKQMRWKQGRCFENHSKNAQGNVREQQEITMTAHQLDQLLKLIPRGDSTCVKESETDEEIDYSFSGMVTSRKNKAVCKKEWIIDSGTSDHMSLSLESLSNIRPAPATFSITLPIGATAVITHIGDARLPNGLKLMNVLYVPQFHHNLLSIHKLAKDSKCDVIFGPGNCTIIDSGSKTVIGKGEVRNGLYYLLDDERLKRSMAMTGQKIIDTAVEASQTEKGENEYIRWHLRLGHASISKMLHIEQVKHFLHQ